MTKKVLRWIGGFLLGLAIWLGLGMAYHPIVAFFTESTFNLFEHPNITSLQPEGEQVLVRRSDFDARSPFPKLTVSDLTFNVVLVAALAMGAGMKWKSPGLRIAAAAALLLMIHVAALYAKVMSIYVLQLGAWSEANYGPVARNVWPTLTHFYRFVGCYAFAFLVWWYPLAGGELPRKDEK